MLLETSVFLMEEYIMLWLATRCQTVQCHNIPDAIAGVALTHIVITGVDYTLKNEEQNILVHALLDLSF